MAKESDWATYSLMEAPFWRNGMTPEEYEEEREYYYMHLEDVKKGTYKPLWQQDGSNNGGNNG